MIMTSPNGLPPASRFSRCGSAYAAPVSAILCICWCAMLFVSIDRSCGEYVIL
jgi:hypothetical protein